MAAAGYRIYPEWKEIVVYDEGDGRILRFDGDSVGDGFDVAVPAPDLWVAQTPPWAHERRGIILERPRAARCTLREVGVTSVIYRSPDGSFFVETCNEPDDRGFPLPM